MKLDIEAAWFAAQLEKEYRDHEEAMQKYVNPPCENHPDRGGHAFYRHPDNPKKVGTALCLECLEKRLEAGWEKSLKQHAEECKFLDELAVMFGDGVKKVYPGELEKAKSIRKHQ